LNSLSQFGGKCRQLPQLASGFDWPTSTVALTVIVGLIFGASDKFFVKFADDFYISNFYVFQESV
jgi:hypothetical protein